MCNLTMTEIAAKMREIGPSWSRCCAVWSKRYGHEISEGNGYRYYSRSEAIKILQKYEMI